MGNSALSYREIVKQIRGTVSVIGSGELESSLGMEKEYQHYSQAPT